MDRLDSLIIKLIHVNEDVRIRAATNILFKIKSGVIFFHDMRYEEKRQILFQLVETLDKSMEILYCDSRSGLLCFQNQHQKDYTSESCEKLFSVRIAGVLLCIIQQLCEDTELKSVMSNSNASDKLKNILDRLYYWSNIKEVASSQLGKKIEQTIRLICSAGSIQETGIPNSQSAVLESNVFPTELTQRFQTVERHSHRQAGAILNTQLATLGWKFPSYFFSDYDEKFLFDLEVKIKLLHPTAPDMLWSVLQDFPPEALLQKTGLLFCILDMVGSTFSQHEIDVNPLGFNPIAAINWLQGLITKSKEAFAILMDGNICSRVPTELITTEQTSNGQAKDTLQKLSRITYQMKHPLIFYDADHSTESSGDLSKSLKLESLRASNVPSYSGIAFAVTAAAMPLLQTSNCTTAAAVVKLLNDSIPLIIEQVTYHAIGDMKPSIDPRKQFCINGKSEELCAVEIERFQHLFNRMEQLILLQSAPEEPSEETSDLNNFISKIFVPYQTASKEGQEDVPIEINQKASIAFNLTLLRILIVLIQEASKLQRMRFMSYSAVDSNIANLSKDDASPLMVGHATIRLICFALTAEKSLLTFLNPFENLLGSVLAAVDPAAWSTVQDSLALVKSTSIFKKNVKHCFKNEEVDSDFVFHFVLTHAEIAVKQLNPNFVISFEQSTIANVIPFLMVCSSVYDSKSSAEFQQRTLNLFIDGLKSSNHSYKLILFQSLLAWLEQNEIDMNYENYFDIRTEVVQYCENKEEMKPFSDSEEIIFQNSFMAMLNIQSDRDNKLVHLVADPMIVQLLGLVGLLQADDLSATTHFSHSEEEIQQLSQIKRTTMKIYLHIFDYMINLRWPDSEIRLWLQLYNLFKLIQWEYSEEFLSNSKELISNDVISMETSHPFHTFIKILENSAPFDKFPNNNVKYRAIIGGLFHMKNSVRILCAMQLRRLFNLETLVNDGVFRSLEENINNIESLHRLDPFDSEYHEYPSKIQLTSAWPFASLKLKSNSQNKSNLKTGRRAKVNTHNHQDVRRLSTIAFPATLFDSGDESFFKENCWKMDAVARSAAIYQLHAAFQDDHNLLMTSNLQWLHGIALHLTSTLSTVDFLATSQNVKRMKTKTKSSELTVHPLRAPFRLEECKLILESAKLLTFLILVHSDLRQRVVFCSRSPDMEDPFIPVLFLVKSFFHKNPVNGKNTDDENQMVHTMRVLYSQCLFGICFSTENWNQSSEVSVSRKRKEDQKNALKRGFTFMPLNSNPSDNELTCLISVPHFVTKCVGFPVVVVLLGPRSGSTKYLNASKQKPLINSIQNNAAKQTMDSDVEMTKVFLENINFKIHWNPSVVSLKEWNEPTKAMVDSNHVFELTIMSSGLPSPARIRAMHAATWFELLSTCKSHEDMRQSMEAILLETYLLSDSSIESDFDLFLNLDISPLTALSGVLTLLPVTVKDHITFARAINFLNEGIKAISSKLTYTQSNSKDEVLKAINFCNETCEVVMSAMNLFFESNRSVFELRTTQAAIARDLTAKQFVFHSFLQLLLTLSTFDNEDIAFVPILSTSIWPQVLFDVMSRCSPSDSSSGFVTRSIILMASKIIENLLGIKDGFTILSSNQLPARSRSMALALNVMENNKLNNPKDQILDRLLEVSRMTRYPDSMQGLRHFITVLNILCKYLQLQVRLCGTESLLTSVQRFDEDYQEPDVEEEEESVKLSLSTKFGFLLALMHNRSNIIKLLSIRLLRIIFVSGQSYVTKTISLFDQYNNSCVTSSHPLSPLECLYRLLGDESECIAVKSEVLEVLQHICLPPLFQWESEGISSLQHLRMEEILNGIAETLSINALQSTFAAVLTGVNSSFQIIEFLGRSPETDVWEWIHSAKIIHKVIDALSPNVLYQMQVNGLSRLHLLQPILRNSGHIYKKHESESHSEWLFQSRCFDLEANLALISSICRFLCCLHQHNLILFNECFYFSRLIPFIAFWMEELKAFNVSLSLMKTFNWLFQLIILRIQQEDFLTKSSDNTPPEDQIPLTKFASRSSFGIKLLKSITYFVAIASEETNLQWISTTLKTICLLLENSHLILGSDGHPIHNVDAWRELFNTLVHYYDKLPKHVKESTTLRWKSFCLQFNFTLSMIFQHYPAVIQSIDYVTKTNLQQIDDNNGSFLSNRVENIIKSSITKFFSVSELLLQWSNNELQHFKPPSTGTDIESTPLANSVRSLKSKAVLFKTNKREIHSKPELKVKGKLYGGENRWRDKARTYAINIPSTVGDRITTDADVKPLKQNTKLQTRMSVTSATASVFSKKTASDLDPGILLEAYASLILLNSILSRSQPAQRLALSMNLQVTLVKLLKFCSRWSISDLIFSKLENAISERVNQIEHGLATKALPTCSRISALILSVCSALIFDNSTCKVEFSSVGCNVIAEKENKNTDRNAGNALHQLVSMGISSGISGPTKYICLTICGSLFQSSLTFANPTMRSTLARVVLSALQQRVHRCDANQDSSVNRLESYTREPSFHSVYFLLQTITSYLSRIGDQHATYSALVEFDKQLFNEKVKAFQIPLVSQHDARNVISESMEMVSLPTLLSWIDQKYSHIPCIQAGIARCIGGLMMAYTTNSASMANALRSNILAIISTTTVIDVLKHQMSSKNKLVRCMSSLALWSACHHSEKVKSLLIVGDDELNNWLDSSSANIQLMHRKDQLDEFEDLIEVIHKKSIRAMSQFLKKD